MLLLQRIGMAATAVAISLLCFSSWLSMRESPSRLERGQAKVFLSGLALLVAAVFGIDQLGVPGGSLTAVTFGAALSPLPLGYAIASHHLFAFDIAWRRTISHVVYLSIWSGLFFVGVVLMRDQLPIPEWLRNPVVMFVGVYFVLAPLDGIRHLLKSFIERAFQPGSRTWTQLSRARLRLAHLRDPDASRARSSSPQMAPNAGVRCSWRRSALRLAYASARGQLDPGVVWDCAWSFVRGGIDLIAWTRSRPRRQRCGMPASSWWR
jgi:hypothetical protein